MTPEPNPPLVVLTFAERIVAVNAHTGDRVWEFATDIKTPYAQVRVDQGRVLLVAKGTLFCLHYEQGTLLWKASVPRSMGDEPNVLVYAGCVLVTGTGEAAGFALHDGSLLWHDPFKGYGIHGGAMAAPGVASPIDRRAG
jgi:outer membrane protein assembly factor BamB